MRRLSISLLGKPNANISLETYFAVTSNTVQLGARVDLLFKAWKVEVVGYVGFDALFQFNPFKFIISAGAMFAVRWDGKDILAVDLGFRLEGPTPWRARGHAKFKVLFVKVKVNFDKTFGEKKDTSLPDVAVVPLLVDALENNDSWLAEIPSNRNELVKVKVPVTNDVVIHPAGTFTIRLRRNGSVSRSKLSFQNKAQAKYMERQIKKLDDTYRIVNSIDMTPYTEVTYTYSEARETLAAIFLLNPNLEGLLQIIPSHELVTISTGGGTPGPVDDAVTAQVQEDEALIEDMAGAF